MYLAVSALCLFASDSLPSFLVGPPGCALLGPPLLLVWGAGAIPMFLGLSAPVAASAWWCARARDTDSRIFAVAALVLSWAVGGLVSFATSV